MRSRGSRSPPREDQKSRESRAGRNTPESCGVIDGREGGRKRRRGSGDEKDKDDQRRSFNRSERIRTGAEQKEVVNNEPDDVSLPLPITDYRTTLIDSIHKNQVIVCTGETGSGKTTQIPQYVLEEICTGQNDMVAVTQPRRVAAMSVAARVAQEMGVKLGRKVGYSIRFEDRTSSDTRIKFMTDGMLIREFMMDPDLRRYKVVMLDEAHERSIHTDILFGLLKKALKRRPDLKAIISSATLDVSRFSEYFGSCPVLVIPGRAHPVDIYHSKTKQIMTAQGPLSRKYVQDSVTTTLQIHRTQGPGHILIFLTGQEEIEEASRQLQVELSNAVEDPVTHVKIQLMDTKVLPLYGALTAEAQSAVFSSVSPSVRKIIISTNIAETSVTVPGVRFVVDCGYVKQKVYDPSRRMESLVVVPISVAAANQRAGRAGRTGPGQCYRLYSKECLSSMAPEMIPEIKRSNLANTVLYLKVIGVKDVLGFDYLDAPAEDQLEEALRLLYYLQAVDVNGDITALGIKMSRFPLEPCLSRVLLTAVDLDCVSDALTLVSMLSVENIWYKRPPGPGQSASYRDEEAEAAHTRLRHPLGDCITYCNVYRQWERAGYSDTWARQNFIRIRALRMARNVRAQLASELQKTQEKGSHKQTRPSFINDTHDKSHSEKTTDFAGLRQALCSGFFMNGAQQCSSHGIFRSIPLEGLEVETVLHIHPSSGVGTSYNYTPYVIFIELVSAARPCMRHVTGVELTWIQKYSDAVKLSATSMHRLTGRRAPENLSATSIPSEETLTTTSTQSINRPEGAGADVVAAARARALARKQGK